MMRGLALAERALDAQAFDADMFPAKLSKGARKSRAFLVTGGNSAGKSLLRRVVGLLCREGKQEMICLSMEGRSGSSPVPGIIRSMIYGDETYNATGLLSSHLVSTGIKTCLSRSHKHVIFWDEPDVGLSDESAAAIGIQLADFAGDLPSMTDAMFVATHSRYLARNFAKALPNWIHFGKDSHGSIESWTRRKVVPADMEKVAEEANRKMRFIFSLGKE